jgi:glycosyltransferase involved in cell wall biosynthesis
VPTALLDLTVLSTEARVRGIGRYVADLGTGVARVSRASSDLRVLGIERLTWLGTADVTDDIAGAIERLCDGGMPRENHLLWAYRLRVALARASRAIAPDLVHTGHPNATPLGELRCPRLTTCHDLIPLHYPDRYLDWRDGFRGGRERLDYRRFHSADHVIAVSETTANDLVTLLGVPADRITVVYNGVDLERWSSEPAQGDSEVRARYGLDDKSYMLYVGAADWRKNHDGMLRALAIARRRAPDVGLVLAWAARLDGETQRRLRREARELGVGDALLLLDYVPDRALGALYRGAVAQLFVSRAEGFGYPVVEAMAAGCPVITSNRSSMAEIAADAAVQVDPEDPRAIADAILELVANEGERRSFSARGTARARRFSLERMAEETVAVYRDVISHTRRRAVAEVPW